MEHTNTNLSDEVFKKLKDLIYDISGIFFNQQKKYLLETRLSRRLSILNLSTFEDYYNFLKYSPQKNAEAVELLNSITTNETSFFRDLPQLNVFMDVLKQIASEISPKQEKKIRIWSAGCSTGEEPYTLAIMIKEAQAANKQTAVFKSAVRDYLLSGIKFEIVGSDISENVLTSAKKGVYNSYTLRNVSAEMLTKYFDKTDDDNFALKYEIKNMTSFFNVNLVNTKEVKNLNFFDIVFCRNVIIYFDEGSKKKVILNIYDNIRKGGYLFLGHSESLHFISTSFKLVGIGKTPLYRKE